MRIASLLPGATEMVCALGLEDHLVGVSHECDFPPEIVASLPRLTRSTLPEGLTDPEAIDAAVREKARRGEPLYVIDEEQLAALEPDLILTQALCEVCAVPTGQALRASGRLRRPPRVLAVNTYRMEDIFESLEQIAEAAGVPQRAASRIREWRRRLARVEAAVASAPRPRVLMLEWLEPPFCCGHWVPEMVEIAGGTEVLGRAGEPSRRVRWEEILEAEPEVLALVPCGYRLDEVVAAQPLLDRLPFWTWIPAVQQGQVYALDASAYFSRPGPRTIDGIELLAALLHPKRFYTPLVERAARRLSNPNLPLTG
ncbi:cobalamin-binding protein [Thermoflexus sp.]|nr:cobalamin-binding protein [Thermoflexus sp.]MCS6964643.1 cobalamin-binding protein [Thermoflexus sp.]MCX7689606.1 cobalamin-binding protein [Thermoflexus sp.]MDW8184206.1 cobalamin-binding protein [Anaerolineae bacterium]